MNRRQPRMTVPTHFRLVITLVAIGVLLCPLAQAEPVGPTARGKTVTKIVSTMLSHTHLLQHPLDDEISERFLNSFLRSLDPMKVYFTQQDVDEFLSKQYDLDDRVRQGDIQFAYDVFDRFLSRVDERVALVENLLSEDHDFSVDESIITDPDHIEYAANEQVMRDRWRKRVKYDLLVQKSDEVDPEEATEKLLRRYRSFRTRMHQTDEDELLERYLTSLSTSYDPHTSYMSPSTLENFEIAMRLELDGIGASLQFEDGYTVVHKIIPGGAADRDGRLKPEDKIVGVGQGEDGEIDDVVDMKLSEVVQMIRGKRGTVVRLQVMPEGKSSTETINITRDKIELKDSEARGEITERGAKPDGSPYRIGVIELPSFYLDMDAARRRLPNYKSTTRDVRAILNRFKQKGIDAVVMDLRYNGGGSLNEAIKLTGLFIDRGPVVQVKGPDGRVQSHDDTDPGVEWGGPLVVLINKFSASASEIFAGAIQDYRRGLIVGDHATHGKGTVQTLRDLSENFFVGPNRPQLGALKITMQQFYRPNGDSTQNRGVLADVELPSVTTFLDVGESDLDYAVEFDRVNPAGFRSNGLVDSLMIEELVRRSEHRRSGSSDFQKLKQKIERYLDQKERATVSLNEATFLMERAELDADEEEEKELEQLNDPDDQVVERSFYFDEALDITVDYLGLINANAQARTRGGNASARSLGQVE